MTKQKRPHPILFELQQLVIDLALIDRNHHLARQERAENDIEHSFAVAMLCWYLRGKIAPELNLEKIIKYALAHDFVERYAGDINTYASAADRKRKIALEKEANVRLGQEFKDFDDLVLTLRDYELQSDEESLFVWSIDKIQSLVLADMDDWRPYKKIGVTYDMFHAKHSEQLAESSAYSQKVFKSVFEYCLTTFPGSNTIN